MGPTMSAVKRNESSLEALTQNLPLAFNWARKRGLMCSKEIEEEDKQIGNLWVLTGHRTPDTGRSLCRTALNRYDPLYISMISFSHQSRLSHLSVLARWSS